MRTIPLFLLFACGGPSASDTGNDDACAVDGPPTLEIGHGAAAYVAVTDGGEIELVHGAQGGFHIELGLRATGIDASDLIAATLTGRIGGDKLATSKPWLQFRCNPDTGTWDAWGSNLIYDSQPELLDGQLTVVQVVLTDVSGVEVSADTTMTIQDPTL